MLEPVSINRIEEVADGTRVVFLRHIQLFNPHKTTPLEHTYDEFFVEPVKLDSVRVGTAQHPTDEDSYEIHEVNGVYAEVPLIERPLEPAETAWCEETHIYSGDGLPTTVYEFIIPDPTELRDALLTGESDQFDCLDAIIEDPEKRHRALTSLQESIEQDKFRENRLNRWYGSQLDLDPEWDPNDEHTDHSRERLYEMVSMRLDGFYTAFKEVSGFDYTRFFHARERLRGVHEPGHPDHAHRIAFDVLGRDDWAHCRFCLGAYPRDQFLHIARKGRDGRTYRTCRTCAEQEVGRQFTEEAVNRAKDEYAQTNDGQRLLDGYVLDDEDGN